MAVGLDEILANLNFSQKFFRAHLNGIRDDQWDWKPYPACRSIREIYIHWAESFAADDAALRAALEQTLPDAGGVQQLMRAAGKRYGAEWREKYADAAIDSPFGNGLAVGTVLASLGSEENYHSGQVAMIRLATDPEWDWVKAVHQTREG